MLYQLSYARFESPHKLPADGIVCKHFFIKCFSLPCGVKITIIRRHAANVAQLVEQLIRNEQVVGSNPSIGSTIRLSYAAHETYTVGSSPLSSLDGGRYPHVGETWGDSA